MVSSKFKESVIEDCKERGVLLNMITRKGVVVFAASLFWATFITGCDFINTVKEYFQGTETTEPSQPSPAEKSASAPKEAGVPVEVGVKAKEEPLPGNFLARVGKWAITPEEFRERLNAIKEAVPEFDVDNLEAKKLVLEELVRQQLLVQEAEQSGLANQKDIKAAVEEFKRTLIVQEAARRLVEGLHVTDDEAKAFYEEKKDLLVEPPQWHVRAVIVDSQLKANELMVELLKGADFAEMAKQHSIGKSAAQGGDLGFMTEAPFPEMANALLPLNPGDLSSVFKGPEGYYIVKLEEKKEGSPLPFEKIKEEIVQDQMLRKQQKVILDHIEQLKKTTTVEIKEERLP
jgi:peptidyl-prolyl cis-trans isomerase C